MSYIVAWVLIICPLCHSQTAVAGIVSEEACIKLGEKIKPKGTIFNATYSCYSYEAVK